MTRKGSFNYIADMKKLAVYWGYPATHDGIYAAICDAYRDTRSTAKAGKYFGMTGPAIAYHLKKKNIPRREKGGSTREYPGMITFGSSLVLCSDGVSRRFSCGRFDRDTDKIFHVRCCYCNAGIAGEYGLTWDELICILRGHACRPDELFDERKGGKNE